MSKYIKKEVERALRLACIAIYKNCDKCGIARFCDSFSNQSLRCSEIHMRHFLVKAREQMEEKIS